MMTTKVRVPLCVPDIDHNDRKAVMDALNSQWLTGGERTLEFEEKFAKYIGVKRVVAVNSGTAALHLAMRALGIGEGDEVIVPTLTFAATANASIFCGAKPVFADVDEKTLNISPESIEKNITKKTRAIVPVHLAGLPCELSDIMRIALDYNLYVIEDCAHSLGATYQGVPTGCLCNISAFSFYPTKNVCTGEGGMVATCDEKSAEAMSLMRSHCMSREAYERQNNHEWEYDVAGLGYNYRMDEMSAALGITQLAKLDENNAKRAKIAGYYTDKLSKVKGITTPSVPSNRTSSWHLYIIRVGREYGMSRDELYRELVEHRVECSVHYKPLHLMSYYAREFDCKSGDCPVAEKAYPELLSLPLYARMLPWQVEYVVKTIKELAK